jgi:hypothetical protein
MSDKQLRERLLKLIEEAKSPLDITYIAQQLGISWWSSYKLVTGTFLEELQQYPEVLRDLPFVCMKSTKSLIVVPNRLLTPKVAENV